MEYTKEENDFIIKHKDLKGRELFNLFCEKFPKHPLKTPDCLLHHKGRILPHATHVSRIKAPLYSVHSDGGHYIIKVAQPNTWVPYHKWVYFESHPEEAGNPLKKGEVLLFLDGNRENITPQNLVRIDRALLAVVNRVLGGFKDNAESNKVLLARAFLYKNTLNAAEKTPDAVSVYYKPDGRCVRTYKEKRRRYSREVYREMRKNPEKYEEYKMKKKKWRANRSEEQKEKERAYRRAYFKRKRAEMTEEQRAAELEKRKEYNRQYRERMKEKTK